jgi:nucleotide-binding universal stress UspA family protein
MPLRSIVVAIDGSEPADRALGLASELARASGEGTLTLVSAISDPVTFAPTPVAGLELVLEAEQQGAERDLAERAERLRGQGLRVETMVGWGPQRTSSPRWPRRPEPTWWWPGAPARG